MILWELNYMVFFCDTHQLLCAQLSQVNCIQILRKMFVGFLGPNYMAFFKETYVYVSWGQNDLLHGHFISHTMCMCLFLASWRCLHNIWSIWSVSKMFCELYKANNRLHIHKALLYQFILLPIKHNFTDTVD